MKTRTVITAAIIAAASLSAPFRIHAAEPNIDEAQRRLEEKAKEKQAQRSREVTITQGELDDLKAQITSLQAEVARLRGDKTSTATANKVYNTIEIGMTKQEVLMFIKQHNEFKLIGISADSGVRKSVDETTTRFKTNSSGTTNKQITVDDKMNSETNGSPTEEKRNGTLNRKIDGNSNREGTAVVETEHVHKAGKRETITIEKGENRREVTGYHSQGTLGKVTQVPDYGSVYHATGTIRVTMIDEVVSAIDGYVR